MHEYLPAGVTLRRRPNHWPPLHTPLVWERNIPNRTAMAMYHIGGGDRKPTPTVVSCTTGLASYDEWNSRAILADWTDHPQRLWDVMENTLASGAELVIHVGPEPKLFPTGFERLSHRIMKQLKMRHLDRLGSSVIPSISRNRWLTRKLPANAVLLRAPFLNHIILEDWLLAQEVCLTSRIHARGRRQSRLARWQDVKSRSGADSPEGPCGGTGRTCLAKGRGFPMDTQVREPETQTFVEAALKLGGKSEEEARTTGTVDRADDQVDALFAARYQTANSPVHRAVWDREVPVDLFLPQPPATVARLRADRCSESLEAVAPPSRAGDLVRPGRQDLRGGARRPGRGRLLGPA